MDNYVMRLVGGNFWILRGFDQRLGAMKSQLLLGLNEGLQFGDTKGNGSKQTVELPGICSTRYLTITRVLPRWLMYVSLAN